jgi:hypothetical protein
MENHGISLQFAGGTVVKARPSKAALQDSAEAWLALAQTQLGSVRYWVEAGDREAEAQRALRVLSSHLERVRLALAEAESAR